MDEIGKYTLLLLLLVLLLLLLLFKNIYYINIIDTVYKYLQLFILYEYCFWLIVKNGK